jgi:lysozyme family protein
MNFSNKFYSCLDFTFEWEGGTNIDPVDRGGLTKYGISSKQYPNLDIKNLTKEDATTIYHNDYWMVIKGDWLKESLDKVMFDCAVNCGQGSAIKWLQMSCNYLGSKLEIDGDLGAMTLTESKLYPVSLLNQSVITYRLERYSEILDRYPKQIKYIRGWVRRANALSFEVINEVWRKRLV